MWSVLHPEVHVITFPRCDHVYIRGVGDPSDILFYFIFLHDDDSALWANTWTFFKKSTLFFDITSLPIFSLCLPHLHNVIRDIFLSEIDETQKKILGLEVLGFDAILQYIAGNQEIRENA